MDSHRTCCTVFQTATLAVPRGHSLLVPDTFSDPGRQLANAAWFIHAGRSPPSRTGNA